MFSQMKVVGIIWNLLKMHIHSQHVPIMRHTVTLMIYSKIRLWSLGNSNLSKYHYTLPEKQLEFADKEKLFRGDPSPSQLPRWLDTDKPSYISNKNLETSQGCLEFSNTRYINASLENITLYLYLFYAHQLHMSDKKIVQWNSLYPW